jgi:translation initiation factor IF-2
MMSQLKPAGRKEFPLLIKGDVQGSVEAIIAALETRIGTDPAVGPLAHSVRGLHQHGIKEMRALAKPLAARGSAAGGVELKDTAQGTIWT